MYDIIMCNSPLDKKEPDYSYVDEYHAAKQLTTAHLFDIMNLDRMRLPAQENKKLIYHGWMMPPDYYNKFYNKCKSFGYELINSPEQYIACHYFNGWYSILKDLTPKSLIVERADIRTMMDQVRLFMHNNNCAVIIKDYVKSIKHYWHEACFIPKEADALHVAKVIATFVNMKEEDKDFQGNLVVRQFVELKSIGNHSKSNMPLTKEFRSFVLNGKVIFTSNYWNQGDYDKECPTESFIQEIADKVFAATKNNLFTIDIAQLKNNDWTVIEVGDGQVSAIPEQENRLEFFKKLLGQQ